MNRRMLLYSMMGTVADAYWLLHDFSDQREGLLMSRLVSFNIIIIIINVRGLTRTRLSRHNRTDYISKLPTSASPRFIIFNHRHVQLDGYKC
jgi:hypothetical protein